MRSVSSYSSFQTIKESFKLQIWGVLVESYATKILSDFEDLQQVIKACLDEHHSEKQIELAIPLWPGKTTFFNTTIEDIFYTQSKKEINISYWPSEVCLSALKAGIVDATVLMSKISNELYDSKFLLSFPLKIVVKKADNSEIRKSIAFHDLSELIIATPLDIEFAYTDLLNYSSKLGIQLTFKNIEHSISSYKQFLDKNKNAAILTFNTRNLIKQMPNTQEVLVDPKDNINFSVYLCYKKDKQDDLKLLPSILKKFIAPSML